MLEASVLPRGLIQNYYQEIADPSYRPRTNQYPVRSQTTPARMELSTEPAKLEIDNTPCYRDMNLYINPTEFGDYISGLYQQAYSENLDTLVSEGRYLAAIEKGNSVAQLSASQANPSTVPIVDIKPKSPPTITYQPAKVNNDYTPGDVTMVPARQGIGLNILI